MKCMVCGREIEDGALCCDQCKEKMAGCAEPERAEDGQAAAESGAAQSRDIAVTKKKSKKWLLVAIPLLLLVFIIGGIWVVKNIDDPNAKFVTGSDGRSIFNLPSDEFMKKILLSEIKDNILSVDEVDRYALIKTSAGTEISIFADERKSKVSAVLLTIRESATKYQMIDLGTTSGVTAAILDEDFNNNDKDGENLIKSVFSVAIGGKSKALFEANGISYFTMSDDGKINIMISPTDQID
ncbi:hypothetical protein [Anaeromassilibacillus senegalensis]|uniref:hypothetical protein n=1 Tax=Anaeromassilibacillus senegalensis TaxID=1673717 RepID=UPI0006833197|nr:hypothetical protein [Anaeromassilibacillus senegalensis]